MICKDNITFDDWKKLGKELQRGSADRSGDGGRNSVFDSARLMR